MSPRAVNISRSSARPPPGIGTVADRFSLGTARPSGTRAGATGRYPRCSSDPRRVPAGAGAGSPRRPRRFSRVRRRAFAPSFPPGPARRHSRLTPPPPSPPRSPAALLSRPVPPSAQRRSARTGRRNARSRTRCRARARADSRTRASLLPRPPRVTRARTPNGTASTPPASASARPRPPRPPRRDAASNPPPPSFASASASPRSGTTARRPAAGGITTRRRPASRRRWREDHDAPPP